MCFFIVVFGGCRRATHYKECRSSEMYNFHDNHAFAVMFVDQNFLVKLTFTK